MNPDQLFARAEEEARLVVLWRRQAVKARDGADTAGCTRRRALALARRCEAAVFNLAIAAERLSEQAQQK